MDSKGESTGVGDGEVIVTDLDQDSFTVAQAQGSGSAAPKCQLQVPLKVRAAEDGGAKDDALARLFTQHGLPLLKARLAEFCSELVSYDG